MSEEEKIERLLNSIAKGCDGSIADEVNAIIIKQQKEIERKNKLIEKNRIALENCLKYRSEEDYE